jgi:hypothetical protein
MPEKVARMVPGFDQTPVSLRAMGEVFCPDSRTRIPSAGQPWLEDRQPAHLTTSRSETGEMLCDVVFAT